MRIAGRFHKVELLGDGTFSEVWRCEDTDRRDHDPAYRVIKVFRPSARGDDSNPWPSVRSEMRGALTLAGQPHVAIAEGLVHHDNGDIVVPCLLFKDRGAVNLATWLEGLQPLGDVSLSDRLRVLRDALAGLVVVHEAGIAHCDIGFGNIFVVEPGAGLLGDFGAAQFGDAASGPNPDAPTLRPIQPPPYGGGQTLSVEQARDLYAFAVIASMAISGRHPLTDHWQLLHDGDWIGPDHPYRQLSPRPLYELLDRTSRPRVPQQLAAQLLDLLRFPCQPRDGGAALLLAEWPAQ